MIVTRSPMRISLGGGGTDLPSYYRKHTGFLIAAAINQYVCVLLNKNFAEDLLIKHSKIERVSDVNEVEHPIIRECLKELNISGKNMEITTLGYLPGGTGLGSSSSFTTALLKALYLYENKNKFISTRLLAEQACKVELERLKEPVGKQDQYIAAFGGVMSFEFLPDDRVVVKPLALSKETLYGLEDSLMLFYTGYTRSASNILKEQNDKTKTDDEEMTNNLHFIKELGYKSKKALESGDLIRFGELMHMHWEHKKQRSNNMSSSQIDEWYDLGLKNGAIGGKIIGAGGGGVLMFFATDKIKLRHAMMKAGLEELRFKFDFEGTKARIF